MPTISFEPIALSTNKKLFALLETMMKRGWYGSIGIAKEHTGDGAETILILDLSAPADVSPDGDLDSSKNVRRITARVGDIQISAPTITVMSPELYAATYGETP